MAGILGDAQLVKEATEKMRKKYAGTLTGLSTGNALGGQFKSMTASEIAKRGEIREMTGGGVYGLEPGEYTNGTEMMLAIAESLIDEKRCNPADIAKRLYGLWQESGAESPTNESVVRCAPLSLAYCCRENALIRTSQEVSAITHNHPESMASCVFITVMIAWLLLGADKRLAHQHALSKTREVDPAFVKKYFEGYYWPDPQKRLAVNTLLLATSSFMGAKSFEEAVVRAVNLGGDADTTGAVTGALAGACYGIDDIPLRWSVKLNPKSAKYFTKLGNCLFEASIS